MMQINLRIIGLLIVIMLSDSFPGSEAQAPEKGAICLPFVGRHG